LIIYLFYYIHVDAFNSRDEDVENICSFIESQIRKHGKAVDDIHPTPLPAQGTFFYTPFKCEEMGGVRR
jgi:hypothetical protein